MRYQTITNENADNEKELNFHNEILQLQYQNSISASMNNDEIDFYSESDKNIQVGFFADSGKLCRIQANESKGHIIKYNNKITSEKEYRDWLEPIIIETLGVTDLSLYKYSCHTDLIDNSSKNHFIIPFNGAEESVRVYSIEYAKYFGNYKTADVIKVLVNSNGDIRAFVHNESGIDETYSINIDEKKLTQTIETTIHDIYASKRKIKSYEIQSKLLKVYEGKLLLLCGVIIETDDYNSAVIIAVNLSE